MKILLVVSPYHYPHAHAMRTELLGVLYLASSLRARGHKVAIFDPTIEPPQKVSSGSFFYGRSDEEVRETLLGAAPDVVGISCHYAYSHQEAYRIAAAVKELRPGTITVMGGLFGSVYKEKLLLDCPAVDYVLMGEAEQSFPALLAELSSTDGPPKLDTVDGLLYRDGGRVARNEKRQFIGDLDVLPFPARDLVDTPRYMNSGTVLYGLGEKPTLTLLTSRSCPYGCTFCNMKSVHGPRWRARSPENVIGEIEEIIHVYGARQLFVMDDNFTFSPERAKAICEAIIRKNYRLCWNTPNGISVKKVDLELARLMKRSGCANVCIGIESGSEYIRNDVMKKAVSNAEIFNAVRCFKAAGIPVGGFIMIGMPGETQKYFDETLCFLRRLPLSFIAVTFVNVFKGTAVFEDLVQSNNISADFVPSFDNYNYPVFTTSDFSEKELLNRRRRLLSAFYLSHAPAIMTEFLTGRLNWMSLGMLKRVLIEKYFGR